MKRDLYINNKDAWKTWGVNMGNNFIDTIDGFCEMKDYISNESRLEHGKRIIATNPKVAAREITLSFTIKGEDMDDYRSKRKNFQDEMEKGKVDIYVPALGEQKYRLLYTGKSVSYGMSMDRCFGHVSAKFIESNPKDRGK